MLLYVVKLLRVVYVCVAGGVCGFFGARPPGASGALADAQVGLTAGKGYDVGACSSGFCATIFSRRAGSRAGMVYSETA